jgi:hypothetical protein
MALSHTRVRVAPNLYQRGDGRFVAGFTLAGTWRMKTLAARTKREAKLELARLQASLPQPGGPAARLRSIQANSRRLSHRWRRSSCSASRQRSTRVSAAREP